MSEARKLSARERAEARALERTSVADRIEGERVRARHAIERLRSLIDGAEIAFSSDYPATEAVEAVLLAATNLTITAARLDAFRLAKDGR